MATSGREDRGRWTPVVPLGTGVGTPGVVGLGVGSRLGRSVVAASKQHMQVEAPYLPTLNGDADTSRYDKYPDSEAAVEEALSGEEAVAFSSYFQ